MNNKLLPLALLTACCVSGSVLAQVADTVPSYYGTVCAKKFYDKNANGHRDPGEPFLSGWPMTLTGPSFGPNTKPSTATWSGLASGLYWVEEGTPLQTNWFQSAPTDINGNPINPVSVTVQQYKTKVVKFGNYCKKPSGGRTPGFWSNQNGEALMNDGGTMAPELGLLNTLNLANASGPQGDFLNYAEFETWLLDGNAVNMAYMLSVHLAAMTLNVEAGLVNEDAFYIPFGGTIGELLDDANAALAADSYTPTGDPNRATQEELKNFLDQLNNNALVIPPTPCKRTFYTTY